MNEYSLIVAAIIAVVELGPAMVNNQINEEVNRRNNN